MATLSMTERTNEGVGVTTGVDTHADAHVAAAFDDLGRRLGHLTVATTPAGYAQLLAWAQGLGTVRAFGVEGPSSYGAGLTAFLTEAGCVVLEVNRPSRQARRLRGKSDPLDAEAAARAVLAGDVTAVAKSLNGRVGMIKVLRVGRRSAMAMRTQVANQIHALVVTAPASLREQVRELSLTQLVAVAARFRPGTVSTPETASKFTLRGLATRHQSLSAELEALDVELARLTAEVAPALMKLKGVGPDVAGALLVAAGDNPERLRSEAAFASLCGVSPVPASSGKTNRHRLNRGGDRIANNALWRIVMGRLSWDERTQRYMSRRIAEGKSKREVIRCLKRYVAREVLPLIASIAAIRAETAA
jgi:transposase